MHLDVAFSTLFDLLTTPRLMFLMAIAVPMGIFFGSTPGLGGKLGLVLLIPFAYNMDMLTGAVFLCAMHAVVHTGGSIPSILIGVPGDGPAAATVLVGFAMTRKGEAGRALGERDPLPVELGEEHREHQQRDEDQRDQRWQQHAQ